MSNESLSTKFTVKLLARGATTAVLDPLPPPPLQELLEAVVAAVPGVETLLVRLVWGAGEARLGGGPTDRGAPTLGGPTLPGPAFDLGPS